MSTPLAAERFRPEARVLRLPEWRTPEGEKPAVHFDRSGEWRPVHPIFIASLEALREGATFEEAFRRAKLVAGEIHHNHVEIFLRRWFWDLRNEGYLDIPLEAPPEVFHGRYRRLKELGRGGVGVAHLCVDERTGAQVVVKHAWGYLRSIQKTEPAMRDENAILKAFHHPGIPRHLDEFEHGGLLHIVREFAEGEPLLARVTRMGRPSAPERIAWMREACDIVQHAHERGYLFLDATPGNFILRPNGRLLAIDVGICRPHVDGRAVHDGQAGTRGYAAPELAMRRDVGVWSDVFGLACVHHFLASGVQPGHKWSRGAREEAAARLDIPDDERALLLDAWEDEPAKRPTLKQMMARFAAWGGNTS